MDIIYTSDALSDLKYWKSTGDKKIEKKIIELIKSIAISYDTGIGKPEYLKHLKAWSRRINQEHRIIYEKRGNEIHILSLKGHYS